MFLATTSIVLLAVASPGWARLSSTPSLSVSLSPPDSVRRLTTAETRSATVGQLGRSRSSTTRSSSGHQTASLVLLTRQSPAAAVAITPRQEDPCESKIDAFHQCVGVSDDGTNECGTCVTGYWPENVPWCDLIDETCSALESCTFCAGCEDELLEALSCSANYECSFDCGDVDPPTDPPVDNTECETAEASLSQCLSFAGLDLDICQSCLGSNGIDGICDSAELCSTSTACGSCVPQAVDHINCLMADYFAPISCYNNNDDPPTPSPTSGSSTSPPNPNPDEECLYELEAILDCFQGSEDALNECAQCVFTDLNPTCDILASEICYSMPDCPCSTCQAPIVEYIDCINVGVCDPITCSA